jgi:hypothetical protein
MNTKQRRNGCKVKRTNKGSTRESEGGIAAFGGFLFYEHPILEDNFLPATRSASLPPSIPPSFYFPTLPFPLFSLNFLFVFVGDEIRYRYIATKPTI